MVFIRATIIKDPRKARALSAKKYNYLRDLQLENIRDEEDGPALDPLAPALVPYDELGTSPTLLQ